MTASAARYEKGRTCTDFRKSDGRTPDILPLPHSKRDADTGIHHGEDGRDRRAWSRDRTPLWLKVVETLTGFKYIGEKISQWEKDPAHDFFFGYEESYGYLAGTHAQDKDAVVSAMLICEMAAYFKNEGKTLSDVLDELYADFGYYYDKTTSYTLKGSKALQRSAAS